MTSMLCSFEAALHKLPDADKVVCNKVREDDERIVRIKEGTQPTQAFTSSLLMTWIQSGSTVIEFQNVLAAHGATKVSAYVTHEFSQSVHGRGFMHKNDGHPVCTFYIDINALSNAPSP